MKYIKLFEGYRENIIPSKPEYYYRITLEEKDNMLGNKFYPYLQENEKVVDKDTIKKLEDIGYEVKHSNGSSWSNKSIFIRYDGRKYSPYRGPSNSLIRIYEVDDDWFIIEIDDRYNDLDIGGVVSSQYHLYKCDRIEGIIECLKDNEIPPTNI